MVRTHDYVQKIGDINGGIITKNTI